MRFAVLGNPITHSKSPAMHYAAYRALGLAHRYEAVRAEREDLPALVDALRRGEWDGFNVTVPHKMAVLDLVDELDVSARSVGAANTLVRDAAGRIVAYNTDVAALRDDLDDLAPARAWRDATILVLGGGGAARAAVSAFRDAARIVVRARTRPADFASEMRAVLPGPRIEGEPLTRGEIERSVAAVIQATSAGMTGAEPGDAVAASVDWAALPDDAVAYDVVYAPPVTPFLRAAEARGVRSRGGITMLARQGARAFELWLGVRPPLDAMLAATGVRGGRGGP